MKSQMPLVKQARVLKNVVAGGLLWMVLLWCLRAHLWEYDAVLGCGMLAGALGALLQWRRLRCRIARGHRRYERNKIFVHYLHGAEMLITMLLYNPYLGISVGALSIFAVFTRHLASWGMIAAGGAGLAWAGVLAWNVLVYERRHGALYYQYDSDTWGGAEGMLYQHGIVVDCLAPDGKVKMAGGVLWNAVSLSGETIAVGEMVEVIALRGLTLYVDAYHEPPSGDR